jgi:hypothetical protein
MGLRYVTLCALTMWCVGASAQYVGPGAAIPVVANNPGVNDTYWRSDVSILNVDEVDTSVRLLLYPEIRGGQPQFPEPIESDEMSVAAGTQLTLTNVVQSVFGLINEKGALQVWSTNGTPLVVSSRVYTVGTDGGSYGQDVSGVMVARKAWASGIRHDSMFRTNVGISLLVDPLPGSTTTFTVTVSNAEGDEVGSLLWSFAQAGLQQRSLDAFDVGTLIQGSVRFECDDPTVMWYAYASRVDQINGDAVFRIARGYQSDLP